MEGFDDTQQEMGSHLVGILSAARMQDLDAFKVMWDAVPEDKHMAVAAALADGMIQLMRLAFPGIHIRKTLENTALFIQMSGIPGKTWEPKKEEENNEDI